MKLHKIRNVALEECCAEQKIAYNIAFRCYINCEDRYRDVLKNDPEEAAALLERAKEIHLSMYDDEVARQPRRSTKYDRDAIVACLDAGLKNYIENNFIATNYKQVGKAFPLPAAAK